MVIIALWTYLYKKNHCGLRWFLVVRKRRKTDALRIPWLKQKTNQQNRRERPVYRSGNVKKTTCAVERYHAIHGTPNVAAMIHRHPAQAGIVVRLNMYLLTPKTSVIPTGVTAEWRNPPRWIMNHHKIKLATREDSSTRIRSLGMTCRGGDSVHPHELYLPRCLAMNHRRYIAWFHSTARVVLDCSNPS